MSGRGRGILPFTKQLRRRTELSLNGWRGGQGQQLMERGVLRLVGLL